MTVSAGTMRRVTIAAALVAPVGVFLGLLAWPRFDVAFGSGSSHFYVVTAVSMLALALAGAVLWSARTAPSSRTLFLALGFLAMAGIFLAHGMGTSPLFGSPTGHGGPVATAETLHSGESVPASSIYAGLYGTSSSPGGGAQGHAPGAALPAASSLARLKVVGYSAQLSLLVSAMFFVLATVDLPERLARGIVRARWPIAAGFAVTMSTHMVTALWFPEHLSWLPIGSHPLAWVLGGCASAGFAFAGWRFLQAYRLAMLPIQGALAFAMVMLIESQWFMLFGRVWHASWWAYHVAMFAGFSIGVAGLLHHYRLTGDLAAIVEGLFLRRQVTGIHAGDPRSMTALAAAVAAKDSETSGHIERVGDLAVDMGTRLWLPEERLLVLRWAGRLHDVGKIGVPDAILRKPGKLTAAEFEVIKTHAPRGWHIAERSGLLREAAPIIRAHHERLDGTGYPDGLSGDQIPVEARIVAVADVWDALTSDRPYRAAMSAAEAAEIMLEETGDHLDAECVRALFETLGLQRHLRPLEIRRRDLAA